MEHGNNQTKEDQRRVERDTRISKRMSALLVQQDGTQSAVVIENISNYGAQFAAEVDAQIGDAITLSVAGLGDFEGVIRWKRDNIFGVHMIDTINIGIVNDQD